MANLERGKTATLSLVNLLAADGGPGDAPADVVFTSSDSSIASVSGNQLTAIAGGSASIGATGSGFTANPASLTVSNPAAVSGDVVVTAN